VHPCAPAASTPLNLLPEHDPGVAVLVTDEEAGVPPQAHAPEVTTRNAVAPLATGLDGISGSTGSEIVSDKN